MVWFGQARAISLGGLRYRVLEFRCHASFCVWLICPAQFSNGVAKFEACHCVWALPP